MTVARLGVRSALARAITNTAHGLVFDPTHPDVFWETGIRGASGLYKTADGGATFKQLGMLSFTQLVSVDFSDPDRKTLVTGTHGMKQRCSAPAMAAARGPTSGSTCRQARNNSESPLVIDSKTYLLGACDQSGNGCGVHRTTDSGATWSLTNDVQVSHYGAPLVGIGWSHLLAARERWRNEQEHRSRPDLDQDRQHGNDVRHHPAGAPRRIDRPGGRRSLAALDRSRKDLATDPRSDSVQARRRRWFPHLLTGTKTIFLAHFDCGAGKVLPDGIMSAGYDYAAK